MSIRNLSENVILVDSLSESETDEEQAVGHHGHSKPKGVALVLAVVLVIILFIIGTSLVELAAYARLLSIRTVQKISAQAAADGDISFDETEEIRLIARGLELSHRDFIDAKLLILGEERIG